MCPVLFVSISANITSASFEHRMNVTKKSYLRVDQHVRLADKNFNNFNRMKDRLIEQNNNWIDIEYGNGKNSDKQNMFY